MSLTIPVSPNMQNGFYVRNEVPASMTVETISRSGGAGFAWGEGPTPTTEDLFAMGSSVAYRKMKAHNPDPTIYAGKIIVADCEKPENPGYQRDNSPEHVQRVSDALDLRLVTGRRVYGNSAQIYVWCAGNALQLDPVPGDYRDMWGLLSIAKHGGFREADGFTMRVYPTAGSDTLPGRMAKIGTAIHNAMQMGKALVEEAGAVDNKHRRVMIQGSFEQFGDDGRPGQDALPAKDIADMARWSEDAEADRFGIWSAERRLAGGALTTDIMTEVAALLSAASEDGA